MSGVFEVVVGALRLVLGLSVGAMLVGHLGAFFYYRSRRSSGATPRAAAESPSVSILKPIEGGDAETARALESFCRQEYSGPLEVVVGYLEDDDPVCGIVDELGARHPRVRIRRLKAERLGANRKTSIMEALWRDAQGDHLLFSDADVSVPPDYVTSLVAFMREPGVGCVTCLPRPIPGSTLGSRLLALHYAFQFVPQWMLARQVTGIRWAIGHTMAVRRDVLDRIQGFRGFLDHLADDYELGNRIARAGWTVRVAPMLVDCGMPSEAVADALSRLQRWKRTIRRARGEVAFGVVLTLPTVWALLLLAVDPAGSWPIAVSAVALRMMAAACVQWRIGVPREWGALLGLPLVDLVEFVGVLGAYLGSHVRWRGVRYRLLPDGTLSS